MSEHEEHSEGGVYSAKGKEFSRDTRYIETRIVKEPREGTDDYPVEPNRYRLIAAYACPWANRAIIVRDLLGLQDVISMGNPGPTHDADSWTFDLDPDGIDPVLGIPKLKDAYEKRIPGYPRGITVPAMVDETTGEVVTNNFPQITEDLYFEWQEFHQDDAPNLWPDDLREEMEEVMQRIYTEVNNGVYRCGFAGSQESYDAAYDRLWTAMDWLEEPTVATSWVTRSPRPTCACSPPSCASTRSTTATSSATGTSSPRCPTSGATPGTCTRPPASATTWTSNRSRTTTTSCTPT